MPTVVIATLSTDECIRLTGGDVAFAVPSPFTRPSCAVCDVITLRCADVDDVIIPCDDVMTDDDVCVVLETADDDADDDDDTADDDE